jgi:hypothetical protein
MPIDLKDDFGITTRACCRGIILKALKMSDERTLPRCLRVGFGRLCVRRSAQHGECSCHTDAAYEVVSYPMEHVLTSYQSQLITRPNLDGYSGCVLSTAAGRSFKKVVRRTEPVIAECISVGPTPLARDPSETLAVHSTNGFQPARNPREGAQSRWCLQQICSRACIVAPLACHSECCRKVVRIGC